MSDILQIASGCL